MKQIKWFDMKGEKMIVRKFEGRILSEDAESITFIYRNKSMTLKKENCFVWDMA